MAVLGRDFQPGDSTLFAIRFLRVSDATKLTVSCLLRGDRVHASLPEFFRLHGEMDLNLVGQFAVEAIRAE